MKWIVQVAIGGICGAIVANATSSLGLSLVTGLVVSLQINTIISIGEIRSKLG
jgi:hypothetical protein